MGRRGGGDFFWIFILIILFGGGIGAFFPLLLIIGAVLAITMAAVNTSNKKEAGSTGTYYRTTGSRVNRSKYSAAQMAKINVYLRSYFRTRKSLPIGSNIDLRIRGTRYASLASLDVYRDNKKICTLNEFGKRYPDSYDEIISELITLSEGGQVNTANDVIDVEVTETVKDPVAAEVKEEVKKEEPKVDNAQKFIDEIASLNDDIPDENISNGLYETCALLKQVQTLEQKFPQSRDKLKKLYEYYLPILVRILKQYDNLQAAQTDPSYAETKERLTRTITLINDAMKTIISSMTDQDFINLSADISTLEAVLQKDGLTSDGQISRRDF